MKLLNKTGSFTKGILRSYSQIFFSENLLFSIILLIVSFIDYNAGLSGLISVIISNVIAYNLGFYKPDIEKGLFGFNSLLTGLGIGYYFSPGFELFIIVTITSVLTLFFVTLFKGFLQKYGLPYLSLPFLFGIWTIMLASGSFESLGISQKNIYTFNQLYSIGGAKLVNFYETVSSIPINESLKIYFNSIGAIFFQFNALAGILISLGLLYYSRIAFLLSLYGFYLAYAFYNLLGGNIAELSYTYIGFNYILTAIALGGFYLIPSRKTFLWLILLIPLVTLTTISLSKVFLLFRLSVYSLPFNIIVLLFLYALKFRVENSRGLNETPVQFYHPETNIYTFNNQKQKEYHRNLIPFELPFWGLWTVSQAHNGKYTHKKDWRHAFDFVITDDQGKQFKNQGLYPTDYYCFGKSVLAPAIGIVEEVISSIPDNIIGKANLIDNWGNTVIIKHADYVYSSLNHLKEGSIIVKKGDPVKKGQKIGEAGNSGRSPYPHLHMQFQATPYIGSVTMDYPFCHFLKEKDHTTQLGYFEKLFEKDKVSNIETLSLIKNTLDFIPGQKLKVETISDGKINKREWEIITDAYNQSFIHEASSSSKAWFINNGTIINFLSFQGKKNTPLYFFYTGFYKILQANIKNITVKDEIPLHNIFKFPLLFFQDITAPFKIFLKSDYQTKLVKVDNEFQPTLANIESRIVQYIFNKKISITNFNISISYQQIIFSIPEKNYEVHISTI